MIRYATSVASAPEPSKAREAPAAKPAIEMPPPNQVVDVSSAGAALAAYPLLVGSESDEFGSDTLPKITKPPRRAAKNRKAKVAEAASTPLQLDLEA
ncbi:MULTISPECIES: poly(hydroxyalkanoate) granule-associated protein [unclassified Rhizobium]|uniref:poly(hydroxyalkanoate) granule-associated protein n=1 Tax=unclassified Rhizobium TaxID=2613769 RepID=UPI001C83896C|nr:MULTISPECIES: poly(hydroxyalkanoate) granule-associated protein [unclassified Rhizobium]MBX5156161.1 poly(hydroxyalkanoate) granule-associated protein [Rhizobium sp. NZLR8]MBX5172067.1 poly(hydroxyalkanoate) granule-associated protein [Rhizobium sp. NZLR1b]MBX5191637.1 poly(hydroxyalkanoate) granule-associated protein [Rhizobium sp. NZLR3b]MBX5196850.1 poly(hydroxyalkanoate) granule-associated protein [Rhizobium sp. NZLR10]MBX5205083.1 poly(hydroxyalkanoate) granule-associated protein [Rhiz